MNYTLLAKGLLPAEVRIMGAAIDSVQGALFPEELIKMKKAVPRRVMEFTAGRTLARSILGDLGKPRAAITVGPARQPIWPFGISGSITHHNGICFVAVAKAEDVPNLGIDLATAEPLGEQLIEFVCVNAEIAHINSLSFDTTIDPYKLIFSIKESIFKCLFAEVGEYFGFQAVSVFPDFETKTAKVKFNEASLFSNTRRNSELNIKFNTSEGYIFTCAWAF